MDFNHWLQSRLTAHGFACGPIDGIIGDMTIKALGGFQASRLLPVTGMADEKTVAALRLPSSLVPPEVKADLPDRDVTPEKEVFQPSKTIWPRQADCMNFYGPVGQNQTSIEVPFDMYLAWDRGTRLKRMTLHRLVAPSALRVLQRVSQIYNANQRADLGINQFGGSLNVRRMRGGSKYSMHSWGIAIDFDPVRNGLNTHKPQARLSHPDAVDFWVAWESEGWLSLGRSRGFDFMHIQAARL